MRHFHRLDGEIVLTRCEVRTLPLCGKRVGKLELEKVLTARGVVNVDSAIARLEIAGRDGEIPIPKHLVHDAALQCDIALFRTARKLPGMCIKTAFRVFLHFDLRLKTRAVTEA